MKAMADVEFDADQLQDQMRPAYGGRAYQPATQHGGRRVLLLAIIVVCLLVTFAILLRQRNLVANKGIPVNLIERTPQFLPK